MCIDPSGYGWTLGSNSYETVPTLDPMAPEELLTVIVKEIAVTDDAAAGRMMLRKCFSACGNCKGITCKNCIDDGESGKGPEIDS